MQSVQVGGLRYTKACYLSRIIDVFGRTVVFTYAEKTYDNHSTDGIREYSDPYKDVPDNQPDAYQSCYETRYLQTLNVINKEGISLFSFDFQYDLQRFTPLSENEEMLNLYGDTYKRILVSVRKTISEGHVLPDVRFSYYMEGCENPGSIRTICYMDGYTVEYVYAHKELVNCDLDLKLYAPVYNAIPRAWLKADYAVVMWYMDGLLSWAVYTWIGRWQKWTSRESEIHDWIDIESLDCLLEDDFLFFIIRHWIKSPSFYPFHADGQILGAWKEIENGYIEYGAGECSIVGSDDFLR